MPKSADEMASKCGNRIRNRIAEYGSTANLWQRLGWRPNDLAKHLEQFFYNDMSWENFASWQIDHTIPLHIVSGGNELEPYRSEEEIREYQEDISRGQDPPHVRDLILSIIDQYNLVERVWSLDNLRPLFKEDHVMKTELEQYLRNRDAKVDDYAVLCEKLYNYYGKSPVERRRMKKYYYNKWPKKWIRAISEEVELETDGDVRTISDWYSFHSNYSKLFKEPKLCKGFTQIEHQCTYKAMRGDEMCYLHTTREFEESSDEELVLLRNMLIHVPTIPRGFFARVLLNSKSRYPSEDYWKLWINCFPMDHPIYKMYDREHYNLEKTDIATMLIRHCSPGITSINTLLKKNGLDLKKFRTKWQKFWRSHEIVLEEFKNEQTDG